MRGAMFGLAGMLVCVGAQAQVILPLDRAEILAGSRFDVKVEFPNLADEARTKLTVNGRPIADMMRKPAEFTVREDGKEVSALSLQGVSISEPGTYAVTATDGDNTATVTWEVYAAPTARRAKNVVLMVGDGMGIANVTAARLLVGQMKEGRYGRTLTMDGLPQMATVGTAGSDSIVTDSANSASAYNTGHKSAVNALGVYATRAADTLKHPNVETLAEIVRRELGMAVGVVTNTEIQDATPAGVFAHTRRRADYEPITDQLLAMGPEVAMGGGSATFLPKSTPGSKRRDERDMVAAFKQAGYTFADTAGAMERASADPATKKLLGLFNLGNMDGALDRFYLKKGTVGRFPEQPDLTQQVASALRVLERNPAGFYLMVESGMIDKFNHPLDWERAAYDTIMLDQTVKVVLDWMGDRDDTLLIVVPDHTQGMAIVGTTDDGNKAELTRDKVGVYADAGFPNYPAPDARGYPPSVDVSKRLSFFYAAYPDYYETYHPSLGGPRVPAVAGKDKLYVANDAFNVPGAQLRVGNLPRDASQGVHSADDAILRAAGPGSERLHGFVDNTMVFRAMAEALGLGR